ncbi:hypothetical protein BpHYR1_042030 [Brachionus plicatilis]|uniref:Uncharacterized protein n=1 Tax=Brachionus plicatilis TaxID=10195 RepID=A0A3M7PUJ1_BRAPC|nr:hypothetical protein BpHYR1_042030 [Brachionus plicatilis]
MVLTKGKKERKPKMKYVYCNYVFSKGFFKSTHLSGNAAENFHDKFFGTNIANLFHLALLPLLLLSYSLKNFQKILRIFRINFYFVLAQNFNQSIN